MKFEDLKKSFLKDIYHLENNIFCIFDTTKFNKKTISKLCDEALKFVDDGFIFQTSGTTNKKKFVVHDFESVKTSGLTVNKWSGVSSKDKFLAPISLNHMGGFSVLVRGLLAKADPVIILPHWSLEGFMAEITKNSVTVTSLVPSLIYQIVQSQKLCPKSLKTVYVGGAALNSDLCDEAIKLGWPLIKTFGSSEACSQIFTQKDKLNGKLFLLPHWNIKLNSEQFLCIQGPSLFKAYMTLNGDCISWKPTVLDEAGFFETEDRVELLGWQYSKLEEDQKTMELNRLALGSSVQKRLSVEDESSSQIYIKRFLGRANDQIKINASLVNLKSVRDEFYNFCSKHKVDPEHNLISTQEDLKTGTKLVVYSDQFSKGLASKIKIWNQMQTSEKRLMGIYFIPQIPRTELGKVKYKDLIPTAAEGA